MIICSIAITATSTTVAAEKSPNGFSERHKAAVAAIEKIGGIVSYKCDERGDLSTVVLIYGRRWRSDWSGLALIKDLERLQVVVLDDETVSDEQMGILCKLKDVKELRIRGDAVTDDGIRKLCTLTQVNRLEIDCPNLTAKAFTDIKNLTALKSLELFRFKDYRSLDGWPGVQVIIHNY